MRLDATNCINNDIILNTIYIVNNRMNKKEIQEGDKEYERDIVCIFPYVNCGT